VDNIVQKYLTDGYVIVEDLVEQEAVANMRDALLAIARGTYGGRGIPPIAADASEHDALAQITAVHHPHFDVPVFAEMLRHPNITNVLGKIVGAHLPANWWDGSVKSMQSMVFSKGPGSTGQSWHQDEAFIPTRDRSLCGAWIALDDATVENGCLWAVPGAHRAGVLFPTRPHERLDEWDATPEMFGFDASLAIPLEAKCGSVVFFNGYLPHMSLRNRSSGFRRVFVSHYMSMQSLLPWNLDAAELEGWRVGVADQRAIVPITGEDPHKDRGYRVPEDAMHMRGAD
jgi:phytanoyl-CoA hydroxylase